MPHRAAGRRKSATTHWPAGKWCVARVELPPLTTYRSPTKLALCRRRAAECIVGHSENETQTTALTFIIVVHRVGTRATLTHCRLVAFHQAFGFDKFRASRNEELLRLMILQIPKIQDVIPRLLAAEDQARRSKRLRLQRDSQRRQHTFPLPSG